MNLALDYLNKYMNEQLRGAYANQSNVHRIYCECGREVSPLDGNEPTKCIHGRATIYDTVVDPNTIKTDGEAPF